MNIKIPAQAELERGTLARDKVGQSASSVPISMGNGGLHPMFTSQPIGFVSSPYTSTSEIPKGLGAKHDVDGVLKILPEFEPGLRDIEGFSHLFVIWEFDRSPREELRGADLLASPPSDNRQHGVFATRSPRRPNPIGLTTVELRRRDGIELHVRGVDMLDGTPILDIKPYLSSIPPEKLRRGWLAEAEARQR
jgi:tRNA (adenine37-N6)-methyltransferase